MVPFTDAMPNRQVMPKRRIKDIKINPTCETSHQRVVEEGEPTWVFPWREGARGTERTTRFARLLEKAELRQIRIHELRHTYATLLPSGGRATYVSQRLGHRDGSIALRGYADELRARSGSGRALQPSATPSATGGGFKR